MQLSLIFPWRVGILSAATAALLLAGCDGQPLRPAQGPTPMEVAAAHFDVPLSTLLELQRIADGIQPPTGMPRPDPTSLEAQRLRHTMSLLEKAGDARDGVHP
jgi:hypothetical protein